MNGGAPRRYLPDLALSRPRCSKFLEILKFTIKSELIYCLKLLATGLTATGPPLVLPPMVFSLGPMVFPLEPTVFCIRLSSQSGSSPWSPEIQSEPNLGAHRDPLNLRSDPKCCFSDAFEGQLFLGRPEFVVSPTFAH
jgi:hypothetical protein